MQNILPSVSLLISICLFNAYSQACCGIGSTRAAGAINTVGDGILIVLIGGDYSGSGAQYSGTQRTTDPTKRDVRHFEGKCEIGYGVSSRFSIDIASSIHNKSKYSEGYIPPPTGPKTIIYDHDNWGIGDGTISFLFAAIPFSVLTKHTLSLGANFVVPWGPTKHMQSEGIMLPIDLQTGQGNWSTGLSVYGMQAWPKQKMGVSALLSGQLRFAGSETYRYGDNATAALTGIFGPLSVTRFLLSLNARYAGKDYDGRNFQHSTGGKWLTIIPGVELKLPLLKDLTIITECEAPLWRHVNGTQLTTGYLVRLLTIAAW